MRFPADRLDPECYPEPGVTLPVFYGDLDTNRHINNVSMGRFFEHARFTLHTGIGIDAIVHRTRGRMLIARVAVDYLHEGGLGPPVHVRTRIKQVGRTSMVEEQAAWQDGACIALAEIVGAYRHNGEAAEWPEDLRALLLTLKTG
ncbi:MAG TPA: thioesterase family protein [Mycobacteriales bacterium]|nr:thioesterase family protein [Mycobacteriales bacterium]